MSGDKIKDIEQIESIYEKHYQRMYKHEGTPRETLSNAMKEYAELYHKQQLSMSMGEVSNFFVSHDDIRYDATVHEVLIKMKEGK